MDKFVFTNSTSNKKQKLQPQSDHLVEPEIENENSMKSTNSCYILDGQFFSIIKEENKNISAQCQMCSKVIQGQAGSTGNFLSHIRVCIIHL